MDNITKAVQYYENGYMCSQAVFAAFAEEFGITEKQALQIGACFGGGMNKGEVCGACTGALMVLGMKYGQFDLNDTASRAKGGAMAVKFLDEFEKRKGSYVCCDILGCDLRTDEGRSFARSKGLFRTLCPEMVRTAAEILTELLGDES
ncbi:C_GCAxxG_C_C family probable redox protein [Ruminococcus sp. YRD2003]|uniref:C-GCAxxG-C-C family protein n=1 Tax=Ruminococcus sp. YRD2003 TaxID=1452313 RepID=UPI0008D0B81A|nr:C_GCAxxG_C_C family probable redox protein [Ruminococcus flavefaciens]